MSAAMTPEQRALRAAYLAELWPTCRELSREERELARAARVESQRLTDLERAEARARRAALADLFGDDASHSEAS